MDNKTPIAIIIGSIIIGIFIYLALNFKIQLNPISERKQPNMVTQEPTQPETKQNPTSTNIPTQAPTDHDLIESALIDETEIDPDSLEFDISENDGSVARGSVRDINSIGGAMWFAAKTNNTWQVTFVGHGVPECDQVNPYNYPTSWVDYCMDGANTVAR